MKHILLLKKLVLYVLHEGRKPIRIIALKLNNLKKSLQLFIKTKDESTEQDIKNTMKIVYLNLKNYPIYLNAYIL